MVKKSKILIIDDETAILNALQIFLEQQGYSVKATDKYAGRLDKAKVNELPDLIILDVLLMEEDGRQVAQSLKKATSTKHIPIILISAHPSADKIITNSGADAFLPKPFDIPTLLATIERLV